MNTSKFHSAGMRTTTPSLTFAAAIAAIVLVSGCQFFPIAPLPVDEPSANLCVDHEVVDIVLDNTTTNDADHAARMLSRTGPFGCVSERDLVDFLDAVEVVDADVKQLALSRNSDKKISKQK